MSATTEAESANPSIRARRTAGTPPGPPVDLAELPGAFAVCPLCQRGEAGAEHLLTWCPATHSAWDRLGHPLGRSPRRLLQAAAWDETAVAFLHQVAFLHTCLAGRAAMPWRAASALLSRAIQNRLAPTRPFVPVEEDAGSDDEGPGPPAHRRAPAGRDGWAFAPLIPCETCREARRFPASFTQLPGTAAATEFWRRQACCSSRRVCAGAAAATLFGSGPTGDWPLSAARWWPPPAAVPVARATARWETRQCDECRQWRASLVAIHDLAAGEMLSVATGLPLPFPDPCAPPAYTLTFDGSFGTGPDGLGTAGAAAVLRGPVGPDLSRATLAIYEARVAASSGLGAEALACAGGLGLIRGRLAAGYCLVIGDSPAIINLGAGAAHVRRAEAALPVVQAIGSALAQGWHLGWERIPRLFNQDADRRARRAAGLSARRPYPPRG